MEEAEQALNRRSPVLLRHGKLMEKGASIDADAEEPRESKRCAFSPANAQALSQMADTRLKRQRKLRQPSFPMARRSTRLPARTATQTVCRKLCALALIRGLQQATPSLAVSSG